MLLSINNDHIKGALVGVGVCAVGYYAYKKNEEQVNKFLSGYGVNVQTKEKNDFYAMSLEELMETKETIEDIIAEKQYESQNEEELEEEIEEDLEEIELA